MSSAFRSDANSAISTANCSGFIRFRLPPVEAVIIDVAHYRVRDVVPDRLIIPNSPTQNRRGDADRRHLEELRALAAREATERLVDLGARGPPPAGHSQRRQRQHPLGLAPRRQTGGDVTADDQE